MIQRVAIDLDGCLCRTTEACLAYLQAQGRLPGTTLVDITAWDWEGCFPGQITTEEIAAAYDHPEMLANAAPCPHLRAVARHLQSFDTEVHIVTARGSGTPTVAMERLTLDWLTRHCIWFKKLVFHHGSQKAAYAQREGIQIFIEDKLETALEIGRHLPVLLIDAPYNQFLDDMSILMHPAFCAGGNTARQGRIWRAKPKAAWETLNRIGESYYPKETN